MKDAKEIELELKCIELEERKLNIEVAKAAIDREKAVLKQERDYLKKDLVEVARRNIELLINLRQAQILSLDELKKKVEPYLKVMENVVDLNK